jgi:signal peptidase I
MDARAFDFVRELATRESVTVRVRGSCMEPLICAGSEVAIRRRRFYAPGDVIVFRTSAGELTAHRVLGYRRRAGQMFVMTKGDHCQEHDPPVAPEAIMGAVAGLAIPWRQRLQALAQLVRIVARRLAR